jgi:hypothetical protein
MSARLRHHMILPPMSSAAGSIARPKQGRPRLDAVVCQPSNLFGSQGWRNFVIQPEEIDPARSAYIDELLAKRRQRTEAIHG